MVMMHARMSYRFNVPSKSQPDLHKTQLHLYVTLSFILAFGIDPCLTLFTPPPDASPVQLFFITCCSHVRPRCVSTPLFHDGYTYSLAPNIRTTWHLKMMHINIRLCKKWQDAWEMRKKGGDNEQTQIKKRLIVVIGTTSHDTGPMYVHQQGLSSIPAVG